jgi:hypothetical protein
MILQSHPHQCCLHPTSAPSCLHPHQPPPPPPPPPPPLRASALAGRRPSPMRARCTIATMVRGVLSRSIAVDAHVAGACMDWLNVFITVVAPHPPHHRHPSPPPPASLLQLRHLVAHLISLELTHSIAPFVYWSLCMPITPYPPACFTVGCILTALLAISLCVGVHVCSLIGLLRVRYP